MKVSQNFVDEGFQFSRLLHNKVTFALLRNLDERITGHVLHTCNGQGYSALDDERIKIPAYLHGSRA